MEKIYAEITLKTSETTESYTLNGEYDPISECLFLQEVDELKTKMTIFFKERTLQRQNKEYLLTVPFNLEEETIATMEFISNNQSLDIHVKTEEYEYKGRSLKVRYHLIDSGETIEYNIKF